MMNIHKNYSVAAEYMDLFNRTFDEDTNMAYGICMDFVSVLNTAMFAIAVWLLIYRTPCQMNYYKWFLLNVMVCAYLVDIWTTIFLKQIVIVLPRENMLGICLIGFLKIFAHNGAIIGWLLLVMLLSFLGPSICFTMVSRCFSLNNNENVLMTMRGLAIMGIMQIGFAIFWAANFYYFHVEQIHQMGPFSSELTSALNLFEQNSCAFIGNVRLYLLSVSCSFASIFFILSIFAIISNRILRGLQFGTSNANNNANNNNNNNNNNTYIKWQRQLLKSLLLQISIPTLLVAFTQILSLFLPYAFGHSQNSTISRLLCSIGATHTSANALLLIFTIKPYRRAIKQKFIEIIIRPIIQ